MVSLQMQRVAGWFHDDVFRRLFINAGKLLSARGVAAVISLIVVAITSRSLGPDSYGVLALVLVYEGTIGRLVAFNAWQAIIKYGSEAQEKDDRIGLCQLIKAGFGLDISSAILGTVLAVLASRPIISLLGWDQSVRELLVLYSALILFSLSGTPIGILRLYDRFDLLSYTAVIGAVIKLIGVAWCAMTAQSLLGFVLVYLITGIIGQLYQVVAALRVLRQQKLSDFHTVSLSGLRLRFPGIVQYVWTTNLHSTVRMLSRQSDELIIAVFTTPAALGLLKIAKQFSQVLPMLIDPLYESIYPELSRLWASGNRKSFRSIVKRSTLMVGSAAILGWFLFVLFGRQIIVLTVGSVYLDAYSVAVWYMLALVIAIVTFSFQPSMLAMGLPKESFTIQVVATIVYLLTLVPFVGWWFGIVGAALSYIVYYIVWSALMFRRLTPLVRVG